MCEKESGELLKNNSSFGKGGQGAFPVVSECGRGGLVNSISLKEAGIIFLGLAILGFTLYSTSIMAHADWKYDFGYDSSNMYMELEAYYTASCLEYEQYNGYDITSTEYEDPTKSTVTSSLLGTSKLFFYSGHGEHYFLGDNYFVVASSQTVGSGDILSLTSVHNGGSQLLGYLSTCHSGDTSWLTDLREAFINQGSGAYLGFIETVTAGDSYQFSCAFYDSLGAGNTVSTALTDALADPDHDLDSGDVVLVGTTSIRVADS